MRSLVLFLLIGMTLSLGTCLADDNEDGKRMNGTWIPSEGEIGAQKLPEDALKTIKLVMKDNKYTVTVGDQTDKGDLKLDSSKKPKTMDIRGTEGPNKDKTFLAIYELDGDSMRICYALEGERPKEFKTNGDVRIFLVTYKRQKP